jgi:hypothetical protein
MLSTMEYVRQSLGLHLFFARIMKEHSFFLEIGFTPKDSSFMDAADEFRMAFDEFLMDVIELSNDVVGNDFLESGEIITPYTLKAEEASAFYTGVEINTRLTKLEENLSAGRPTEYNNALVQRVYILNNRSMDLLEKLIQFKTRILRAVLTCKMFTVNYPLLIDHILREAKLYYRSIQRLQDKEVMDLDQEALEQELFWNRIMAEHSLFIRGLLDPTENELITVANNFGTEFNQLYQESQAAMDQTMPISTVTADSLKAAMDISDFNTKGTQGLLACKIKSIIIPLLGDHVLRESNHYIHLLKRYASIKQ